jgi:tetratricopeptide (TPR) repeat protein
VQRAIPPDLSQARVPAHGDIRQHEAIGDLHLAADNFTGAIDAYRAALEEVGHSNPAERVRLLLRVASVHLAPEGQGGAPPRIDRDRAAAEQPPTTAAVASQLSRALAISGITARAPLRDAYRVLRDSDDHRTVGEVLMNLGLCLHRLGRSHEAIEWFQNAAATFRRIDDTDRLVGALNNLGMVYKNLREWREATRFLEQALRLDERAGLYARMRVHNQNLGLIRYRLGQWDLAEENFRQSLKISREIGHATGEAAALLAFGMLCRRRRQFERAEEHFRGALALASDAGALREVWLSREFLAELELDRGNGLAALTLLEPALADAMDRAPEGDMAAELSIRTGLAMLLLSRYDDARDHLVHGSGLSEKLGDRIEQSIAERGLARLDAARGNAAALETKLHSAAQCFEQLGEVYEREPTRDVGEGAVPVAVERAPARGARASADASRRAATLFRQLG